jgi:nitrogen fixation protein FixH
MEQSQKSPKDKYILFAFLAFFGVIFILDGIFVYIAVSTQTGVVTERAYEKGLEYNDVLAHAKNQPNLNDTVSFKDKILRWDLRNENNKAIKNAVTTARIIRPIQDGHDFDIILNYKNNGIYEAELEFPFKGLWVAKLESQWNKKTYKTTHKFIVK